MRKNLVGYAKEGPVEIAEMSEPVINVQQSSQLDVMTLFNQPQSILPKTYVER